MAATTDFFSNLFVENVQAIFMRLSLEDWGKVLRCCKNWRNLASAEYFCKFKSNFHWRNGIFNRSIVSLPSKIICLVHLDDKILIVEVENDTILIINICNGRIIKSIHAQGLWWVKKSEDKLYAKCFIIRPVQNRVLWKVWSLQSYEEIFNYETDAFITFSHMLYKHLIAYTAYQSGPTVLFIFNIETGKLELRKEGINIVNCSNDFIAIGTKLGVIEIMDLHYNLLTTFTCDNVEKECKVAAIEMKNEYMAATFSKYQQGRTFCVFNLKTKIKLYTIEQSAFRLFTFFNENILIGETNENYSVLDVLTGKSILELSTNKEREHDWLVDRKIVLNNLFLFLTNVEASRIELWCPKRQKLINSFDLKMLSPELSRRKLCPIVSNMNLAYCNSRSDYEVHVMHFGPY